MALVRRLCPLPAGHPEVPPTGGRLEVQPVPPLRRRSRLGSRGPASQRSDRDDREHAPSRFRAGPRLAAPGGVRNRWFSSLARQVDLILAFDDAPPWPNVRRIPPVVRPFSASREKLREDLFLRKKTILVTAGGTAIGEYLLRAAIEAFRGLDRDEVSMVVVSGPRLKVDPEPGVYTFGFLPNLQDYVLAADLVITTGGKGTVNEALAAGTPIIAIPPKGHVDAERNAAALGYRHEDLARLRDLIVEKLAVGRLPPRSTGNEAAVRILLEFLDSKVGPH